MPKIFISKWLTFSISPKKRQISNTQRMHIYDFWHVLIVKQSLCSGRDENVSLTSTMKTSVVDVYGRRQPVKNLSLVHVDHENLSFSWSILARLRFSWWTSTRLRFSWWTSTRLCFSTGRRSPVENLSVVDSWRPLTSFLLNFSSRPLVVP